MKSFVIIICLLIFISCSPTKNTSEQVGQVIKVESDQQDSKILQEAIEAVLAAEPPILIGGLGSLKVNYPERARKRGVQGSVIVEFIVNEKGRAEQISVVRGIGHGCDGAAKNAVKRAKFKPGKDSNGEPVAVIMRLPISFRLNM